MEGWLFKDRAWHLLTSWKADPQEHPALAALPPEGSQETRSGCGAETKPLRDHLGG